MKVLFIAPCLATPYTTVVCSAQRNPRHEKRRFRARVAYDGTQYCGWQFQTQSPTIQAELEKVISRRIGVHVRVVGASRTDSGVHARGQGVHFDVPFSYLNRCHDLQQFEFTVNQMLPQDIRITKLGMAPSFPITEDSTQEETIINPENATTEQRMRPWHSIYCSKGKLYIYRFSTGPALDPLQRLYRYHEWRAARFNFSEDYLRTAASKFVGTHDFSAFTNTTSPPPGLSPPVLVNPFRTIRSADVIREGDGLYRVEFRIDGALYRMIRNVMGTILDVACGKMELSTVDYLFESKDRRLVPKSAPAKGLCLEEVFYDNWEL